MASLTINDIDDAVYERLKIDALNNQRSIEDEVRVRLQRPRMSNAEAAARLRAVRVDPGPGYEGSVALVRAIRDEE